MCGIAGWIDFNQSLTEKDKQMAVLSETLAPRGPDEDGTWKSEHCYFVHRRLVVIDRENGKQPMAIGSGGRKYIICYNGELYNTEDIRKKLLKLGYTFSGHSDTEVLLTSYISWGAECVRELNGIYAFAVWDVFAEKLFLARDRIGVKPLFYHEYDGGILFASEIKTLLSHEKVPHTIDEKGIAELTLLGPGRIAGSGIFSGISEIKPGHSAVFSRENKIRQENYWELEAKQETETFEETSRHIRFLLEDAIKRQLVSDVPLCTFLSGGLDSSIISAVAAKSKNGEKLHTFSVDYKQNRENFRKSLFQPDEDAPWITRMSEFIGSNHTNVLIDTPELADALIPAMEARDLPGMADVDSSLQLFCGAVKKDFPVAVSGECADELFGGYPWYHNEEILMKPGFPWSRSTKERADLLKPGVLRGISPQEFVDSASDEITARTKFTGKENAKEKRMREMFMLNFYSFMQVLLERKDRMSMSCGLEVRVPFCDHRIAEYAYNIPWEIKSFAGREKGLIREAFSGELPDDVLWRKKSPYPKTHNPTYMKRVIEMFRESISRKDARIFEIYDREKLIELAESEGRSFRRNWFGQLMQEPQVFAYLIQFEGWLEKYDVTVA